MRLPRLRHIVLELRKVLDAMRHAEAPVEDTTMVEACIAILERMVTRGERR